MGTVRVDTITDEAGTGAPNFSQGLNINGGAVTSGAYTPVASNIAASWGTVSNLSGFFMQQNDVVSVVIGFTTSGAPVDPSGGSFSLPVASNFTLDEDCGGYGRTTAGTSNLGFLVNADPANDVIRASFHGNGGPAGAYILHCMYRIK